MFVFKIKLLLMFKKYYFIKGWVIKKLMFRIDIFINLLLLVKFEKKFIKNLVEFFIFDTFNGIFFYAR